MAKQTLTCSYDVLRSKNVEALKLMNRVIFPVHYSDQVYKECMATDLTQMAYFNDILVGAVAVRLEKQPNGKNKVYIISLGVLAPYRGYGVGSSLLTNLLSAASKDSSIEEVYLHVQASNEEAIHFYEKFGFVQTERQEGYYKKLEAKDQAAVVLSKKLS